MAPVKREHEEIVSIEGTLLMLDGRTPHVAVVVQAIAMSQDKQYLASTTLSDARGRYRFISLKPGKYQVRCYTSDGYVYYSEEASLEVETGITLTNIDLRFPPFKKGVWRHYGSLDGLAHNTANVIYVAPDGMLWFGTDGGGVSRFDGRDFFSLTLGNSLIDNYVWGIESEAEGVLWFGTFGGGAFRYDGEKLVRFTTQDGLGNDTIRGIYRDRDGSLWFSTRGGGVSIFEYGSFRNLTVEDGLASDHVNVVYGSPDGSMWIGTWDSGVSRYDGGEFTNLTIYDGLTGSSIRAIHRTPDGAIWFGAENNLARYDGGGFVSLTTDDGLPPHSRVSSIEHDLDGSLWIGMWEGGVSCYDGKGFINFTAADGLPSSVVKDIHIDQDGMIWIATGSAIASLERGGISCYDNRTFVSFTIRDGLPDDLVNAVHITEDGVMWIGTIKGVSRYDGKTFENFSVADGLAHNLISSIHSSSDGRIWFGSGGTSVSGRGASFYDGDKFTNITVEDGLPDESVYYVYCDPDGPVWLGTGQGISRYDGQGITSFSMEDGLPDNCVTSIHRSPDGIMWFATLGGAASFDGERFQKFTVQDGMVSNGVIEVYCDPDGMVWFGMLGGVSRYNGKEFVSYTSEGGLAHTSVLAIYRDSHGRMWFGTETKGVTGYDGVTWTWLDTRDGLAGDRVNYIREDNDGNLWFGTNGGLTRYRRSETPSKAYIVSIKADQTYTDLSSIPAFTPGTRVTVEYGSIDFKTHPEKRQYRCRVYETQDARRKTQDKTRDSLESVEYNPPIEETSFDWVAEGSGQYIFEVQAIDRDLNYSEPAELRLTVKPDPVLISMQTELEHLRERDQFGDIIGQSNAILRVQALIESAIESGYDVLIAGETGTGKELVARAIHYNSPRKERPLLDLNCGAVDRELIYSKLFGHRKGAFTGAYEDRPGLFEAASGGTVLLDEIGEMPRDIQPFLLRFLVDRKVQRLGEHESVDVDVRIVAMTNRDLLKEIETGNFREDLYYRLSLFPIRVPPLREHPEDIPLLAEHFLENIGKTVAGFAPGVFGMLQDYHWPGNVRELQNAVLLAGTFVQEGEYIQMHHFPAHIAQGDSMLDETGPGRETLSDSVDRFKRHKVEEALRKCDGNRTEAAKMLGIKRPNLVRLIKRLGVDQAVSS